MLYQLTCLFLDDCYQMDYSSSFSPFRSSLFPILRFFHVFFQFLDFQDHIEATIMEYFFVLVQIYASKSSLQMNLPIVESLAELTKLNEALVVSQSPSPSLIKANSYWLKFYCRIIQQKQSYSNFHWLELATCFSNYMIHYDFEELVNSFIRSQVYFWKNCFEQQLVHINFSQQFFTFAKNDNYLNFKQH